MRRSISPRSRSRGVSMIEILVALVITLIGLFAMLGLNLRAFQTESESYQRSQALVLVDDMAQRIRANRTGLADYATPATAAAGSAAGTCGTAASTPAGRATQDLCEWGNLLRGAAETDSGGRNIGAMADARGCITVNAPAGAASGPSTANVVVVWRGVNLSATSASAPCVPTGFSVSDGDMRVTSAVVRFGDLDGN